MGQQQNTDKSNRAARRRTKRDAARVPGKGAGVPIPIKRDSQPAVRSLRDLAKTGGGQVPLSIPQLMVQVGSLKIERDFWMNAAIDLETQVESLTGGRTPPTVEEVAAADAEEGEIQDIPNVITNCPECAVVLGPEATHAEGCSLVDFPFDDQNEDEEVEDLVNIPQESPANNLTEEEQQVVEAAQASIAGAEQQSDPPALVGVPAGEGRPNPTPVSEDGAPGPSDADGGG